MDSGEDDWKQWELGEVLGLGLRPESAAVPEGQLRIRRGSRDERRGPEITYTDEGVGAPRSIRIQLGSSPTPATRSLRHLKLFELALKFSLGKKWLVA